MARDNELDRLKTAQDLAFQRKQTAYKEMQAAWQKLRASKDVLDRAYEVKQRAYEMQEAAWQEYQRVRQNNGPRADFLKAQQERAFQNMQTAFDNVSNAYQARDGSAGMYAQQGRNYKDEAQGYTQERRGLVQEILDAKERHEATKPDFQRAKSEFDRVKVEHDRLKAEHQRLQAEFKLRKAEFDQAESAFKNRLEKVRAEPKRKNGDKRSIAQRAGVPSKYWNDVWVVKEPGGVTSIYFGGVGKPNGPGHAHYVMDDAGRVVYQREPFDPHGAQNFESPGKDEHLGGFDKSRHGWVEGRPVTFALGWGTKVGHTLIADGHLSWEEFRLSSNHDHYGPGDGPNNNGTLRRKYTGPGA